MPTPQSVGSRNTRNGGASVASPTSRSGDELLRHRRHRVHRPQPGRASHGARGDDLRAGSGGIEGQAGGASQSLGGGRGSRGRRGGGSLPASARGLRGGELGPPG